MKHLKLGAAAIALMAMAGAASAEKLSVYHWFEYIPQELLDKFTAETGIEVVMDTYDSNETLLANLKAGKLGSYDVAVPGDYMVSIMKNEGMLDTCTTNHRIMVHEEAYYPSIVVIIIIDHHDDVHHHHLLLLTPQRRRRYYIGDKNGENRRNTSYSSSS